MVGLEELVQFETSAEKYGMNRELCGLIINVSDDKDSSLACVLRKLFMLPCIKGRLCFILSQSYVINYSGNKSTAS